jgi:hypothetical protein
VHRVAARCCSWWAWAPGCSPEDGSSGAHPQRLLAHRRRQHRSGRRGRLLQRSSQNAAPPFYDERPAGLQAESATDEPFLNRVSQVRACRNATTGKFSPLSNPWSDPSTFINVRINAAMQVTNLSVIRRTIIPRPEIGRSAAQPRSPRCSPGFSSSIGRLEESLIQELGARRADASWCSERCSSEMRSDVRENFRAKVPMMLPWL